MDAKTEQELKDAAKAAATGVQTAAAAVEPKIKAGFDWASLWVHGHPQFAMGFAAGAIVGGVLVYLIA